MMNVITNLCKFLPIAIALLIGAPQLHAQVIEADRSQGERLDLDKEFTQFKGDQVSRDAQKPYEIFSLHRLINHPESLSSLRDDEPEVAWEHGFEDPNLWMIDGPDGFGPENGFSITDQTSGTITWRFNEPIMSESGGNYALFQNGDPINDPGSVLQGGPHTLTYSEAIDISGIDNPAFQYSQFGARFHEVQAVQVSEDGGDTWVTIGDNFDLDALTAGSPEALYPNPMRRSYDIFPHIDENTEEIMIRFFWDNDPNHPVPEQSYISYGWFIDDLSVVETPANNLEMEATFYPPLSFGTPQVHLAIDTFGFSCIIENNGGVTRSGVEVNLIIANIDTDPPTIVHQQTVVLDSFEVGLDSLVQFPDLFAPELDLGTYVIEYSVGVPDEEELSPGNTFEQHLFVVTEDIFSKNAPDANDFTSATTREDDTWYWGNMYFMSPDASEEERTLHSIELAFLPANDEYQPGDGALVYILEYVPEGPIIDFGSLNANSELPPNLHPDFEPVAAYIIETEELVNAGAGQVFSIGGETLLDPNTFTPLEDAVVMDPGKLYGAIVQHEGDALLQPFSSIAQYGTSVGILYTIGAQGSVQYFSGFTDISGPIVRMKVGDLPNTTESVLREAMPLDVYPNPTSDVLNIDFEMDAPGQLEITVYDITGKMVMHSRMDGQQINNIQQDVSSLENGNYYIQIAAEDGLRVSRFIIAR